VDLLWAGFAEAGHLIATGDAEMVRILVLSLVVSGSATALASLTGIPAGVALAVGRFPGREGLQALVNTGMGLPPVVVGLVMTMLLWRTGPLGFLALLYTPGAMIAAQFIVAAPIAAGFTRAAVELLDPDIAGALRVDGAVARTLARELVRAALPQVLVAVAAAFGRAVAEVGASLMVGGNILGQTRTLTTAITLVTSRGDFGLAIALGLILLAMALVVNAGLTWRARAAVAA
jgi:tungstate transport system permease protein